MSSGGNTSASGSTGSAGKGSGGGAPASCKPSKDTETSCSDGKDDDCDGFIDCLDPDCDGKMCSGAASCLAGACLAAGPLTELPRIVNVVPTIHADTAIVDFSPFDGAKDYRIYELPDPADVLVGPNGEVAVKNAVYRCGGALDRYDRSNDGIKRIDSSLAGNVEGYTRKEAESKLGYVYLTPGAGRTAVYRVADPNLMGSYTWEYDVVPGKEFNGADYVTSTEARDALLAKGWRDDGIAFYVPANGTKQIYRRQYDSGTSVFYADGDEKTARDNGGGGEARFKILDAQADDTVPLYRIFYSYNKDHDVLAPGEAMKERVLHQGNMPITSLMWPGLKAETTLVIEALDAGCPFPGGYLGAIAAPAAALGNIMSEPTITPDQGRLESGELFVNGQYASTNRPKPIARAYVTVKPEPPPDMDWYEGFDKDLGTFNKVVDDNVGTKVLRNDRLSLEYIGTNANYTYGSMLGTFVGGNNSSFALAALGANAKIAADKYLHVTMMAEAASTRRRYPQIFITDTPVGDPAVDPTYNVPFIQRFGPRPFDMDPNPGKYHTIIAQTFGPSSELQLEFCDQRGWGVSQQCNRANIYGFHAGVQDLDWKEKWLPLPVVGEYSGMDRLVKFDVFASTNRVYFYVEDKPAGCAVLPAGHFPPGPVNVIFSFAAYHIEIDEYVAVDNPRSQFWHDHSIPHTNRKMDSLGVKSGTDLPPGWDENAMPCGTRYYGE